MKIRRLLVTVLTIVVISIGVSFTLKANIGVGAWDGFSATLSEILQIKIGTMGIILSGSFILIQLFMLRRDFGIKHALQIVIIVILGSSINYMYYVVFKNFTIDSYIMKVVYLIIGYIIIAFSLSSLMLVDTVTMPVEGFCSALEAKTGIEFHIIRQAIDVIAIIVTLLLTYIFKINLLIREGTVIGMLIFGPLIGIMMKNMKPLFVKYDLADE